MKGINCAKRHAICLQSRIGFITTLSFLITVLLLQSPYANPSLTPGVWTKIFGPSGSWANDVAIDPTNPSILYLCGGPGADFMKSTDGGSTWAASGAGIFGSSGPQHVRIDPTNPNHVYVIEGVRAGGFYVTTDGGNTWTYPAGFDRLKKSSPLGIHDDLYSIDLDPTDPNHFLLGYHNGWTVGGGCVECFNGGDSCVARPVPGAGGWTNAFFLFSPALGLGNNQTWLWMSQANGGTYRTTNSGTAWTQVSLNGMCHGGSQIYITKTGIVYFGANNNQAAIPMHPIMRSMDNGITWDTTKVKGMESLGCCAGGCYGIVGDGNLLYTIPETVPYCFTSPENDGINWKADTSQPVFTNKGGSRSMKYDSVSHIVYACVAFDGLWAMKVAGQSNTKIGTAKSLIAHRIILKNRVSTSLGSRIALQNGIDAHGRTAQLFDVKGKLLSRQNVEADGAINIDRNKIGMQPVIVNIQ
jgi:hypothetical protein